MVRSRDEARTAALRAEVVALRATVAELRAELAALRSVPAAAAEPVAAESAEAGWVTLQMPLVKMALGDPDAVATGPDVAAALASPDRGEDTVEIELVLEPSPPPADRLAWSVLANLPERRLLDPTADRDQQPVDHAREAATLAEATPTPGREERRTA
jgi:hypothetical protein